MPRTLVISELIPLYKDMKAQDKGRAKFSYTHGPVTFDVIFFIDENPFSLLFGAKKHNLVFELTVERGFSVTCELPNAIYKALCKALELVYDPNNRFSVTAFLKSFASHIPQAFSINLSVAPHDVAIHRNDVEESSKIYFCGWRDNTVRNEQVTEKNLHKTKRLLGDVAYQACKSKNISSCWTDNKLKAHLISAAA